MTHQMAILRAAAFALAILAAIAAKAQGDRQCIRQGNKLFRSQDYARAEAEYSKAAAKNRRNPIAVYNLGCALFAQQKDSLAAVRFEEAGKASATKRGKAMAYHNLGVVLQKHQLYAEAVEAYKESLRNNPSDNETRYNLALCKRQLKNQPKGGGGHSDEKDKGKDKQNKDKDKEKRKQEDKEKAQKPKEQMSKDNAEQLLNAAMQAEQATQQRLKDAKRQPERRNLDKNW